MLLPISVVKANRAATSIVGIPRISFSHCVMYARILSIIEDGSMSSLIDSTLSPMYSPLASKHCSRWLMHFAKLSLEYTRENKIKHKR